MIKVPLVFCTLASLFILTIGVFAQHPGPPAATAKLSPEKWREDLRYFAVQIEKTHKNAYHSTSRDEFQWAIADLDSRLSTLEDHQVIVEIMRIVAMVGDGHTGVRWGQLAASGMLPVIFYVYEDGIVVQRAAPEHANLVGAKLKRVGSTPIADALERLRPYIWRDNEMGVKSAVSWYLASPKILHATRLSSSTDVAEFVIEKDGRETTVQLRPTGKLDDLFRPPADWANARPANVTVPTYLKDTSVNFRFEELSASKTFYIQFNAVQDAQGETVEAFFKRAFETADRSTAERLVIDLRANGGGNNYLNLPVTTGAIRSRFNVRGKFFVIIGRETFSAAQNAVNDLEKYTNAIFVGEPTGASPNHFGDARPIILPNSKLRIQASTLWWQDKDPRDTRKWTAPSLAADLTSDDYQNGRDPALEAILNYKPVQSVQEIVTKARASGNVAQFLIEYKAFKANPLHKYIDTETILNRVGHFLLGSNKADQALEVFKLNAAENPRSAIVYQSLGDAYAIKGDKPSALSNYEKAVSLDPKLAASQEAIKQLRQK
ncbi:MAG: hypothetical protein ACKVQW_13600 [Pyrinomonadaceae bacterium]